MEPSREVVCSLPHACNWPPIGNKSLSGDERKKLFHNVGGEFTDKAARHGLDSIKDGRGIARADFDNDGRLDRAQLQCV